MVGIHAGHIELPGICAVRTLHPNDPVFLVLVLCLGVALGTDGQGIAVDIQRNVLLLKSRQISFQQIVVTLVGDIGLEFRQIISRKGL